LLEMFKSTLWIEGGKRNMKMSRIWLAAAAIYISIGFAGQARADECPDNAICKDSRGVPEIDSSTWVTGLGFVSGTMLVLRSRRRKTDR
jgi:hypothetical protein